MSRGAEGDHKSQCEKYQDILTETAREAAKITFSRIKSYKELEADTPEEAEKKFKEKSIELWREFAVHGIFRFDHKEKKIKLLSFTDMDGRTSIGLFKMAGFNTDDIEYVEPGKFKPGAINLDTGGKTGLVVSEEDRTAWLDHHGPEADETTVPAAGQVYLMLVAAGFLKKNSVLDKLTQFVSRVDRARYPQTEELFLKSDRTVLGLQRFFNFENLHDYFKQGRSPKEILSDEDLKKYELEKRSQGQKRIIEKSKEVLEKLEKEGFVVETKFGKVVIDVGKKLPAGYRACRAAGYDGYMIYAPRTESFFISINNADLSDLNFSQGVNVRKNMWIKSQDIEDPLKVSLKEIIEKLGGQIPEKGGLKNLSEAIDMKFKEFTVTPKMSVDKKGKSNIITWELGKIAIFPKDFKYKPGVKCKVRIKGDSNLGEKKGFYLLEVIK